VSAQRTTDDDTGVRAAPGVTDKQLTESFNY